MKDTLSMYETANLCVCAILYRNIVTGYTDYCDVHEMKELSSKYLSTQKKRRIYYHMLSFILFGWIIFTHFKYVSVCVFAFPFF